jgi:hypothetical protein
MNLDNYILCTNYKDEYEPEFEIFIYKTADNQRFIKKCVYKSETIYLNIGQTRDDVRLNPYPYFAWVFFEVKEAKKYGYETNCDGQFKFLAYKDLTCDPDNLLRFEEQTLEETSDSYRKQYKGKCPKCNTIWQIIDVWIDERYYTYCEKSF